MPKTDEKTGSGAHDEIISENQEVVEKHLHNLHSALEGVQKRARKVADLRKRLHPLLDELAASEADLRLAKNYVVLCADEVDAAVFSITEDPATVVLRPL